jgi:hypothetical protein
MKKYAILLAALMSFMQTAAVFAERPANPIVNPAAEAVFITKELSVTPKNWTKEDQALHTHYSITYPQITGQHLTPHAKKFNQEIDRVVNQQVKIFTKRVKADMPHMKTLPADVQNNTLRVDYDFDIVKLASRSVISVRLFFESMQAGRAHPSHEYQVVNYDLSQGKVLTLNEMFKPNADYLKAFSSYSTKRLNETLHDKWMVDNGTQPIAKNFKNWNIQNDSILITFEEYQVAPYVEGPQEVEIPLKELKDLLA